MSVSILSARSTRSVRSARSCLSTVSALSDRELLSRIQTLTRTERETTLSILLHLNEIERRDLHLSHGYGSLFDYCVEHLNYSRSAAARRLRTARCIRRFPEVYEMLRRNEACLSTIALVASALTETNKDELLGRIRNKSQREVSEIVARYQMPVPLRDRVKPVCVRVPETVVETGAAAVETAAAAGAGAKSTSETGTLLSTQCRSGTNDTAVEGSGRTGNGIEAPRTPDDTTGSSDALEILSKTRLEQKLLIQFVASKGFMKKYEKVWALLSNKLGKGSFEAVFEAGLDEILARHSPEKRIERRHKRNAKAKKNGPPALATRTGTDGAKKNGSKTPPKHNTTNKPERSRHIPAAFRDKVFVRDQGKCTYVGSSGKRCGATRGLQIDHIVPYARGGSNTVSNLRLLCAQHNRLEAERLLGAGITHRYRRRE